MEDRKVSLQPLQFGPDVYNLRTFNNLPYHRVKAGQLDLLKDQCLSNPEFLIKKLYAGPLQSVISYLPRLTFLANCVSSLIILIHMRSACWFLAVLDEIIL